MSSMTVGSIIPLSNSSPIEYKLRDFIQEKEKEKEEQNPSPKSEESEIDCDNPDDEDDDFTDPEERERKLLKEFNEQRKKLNVMIKETQNLKKGIERLLPQKLTERNSNFLDMRVKSISELMKTELDIRKEIFKSVKDEFELLRKVNPPKIEDGNVGDVRTIANEVLKQQIRTKKKEDEEIF